MKLYHRTRAAKAIVAGGFTDHTRYYLTDVLHTGVWFADRPDVTMWFADRADANEGAGAGTLLVIEIPDEVLKVYDCLDVNQGYREWLLPAVLANEYGPPRVLSAAEESEILNPRR